MSDVIYAAASAATLRFFIWLKSQAFIPGECEQRLQLELEISRAIDAAIAEKEMKK